MGEKKGSLIEEQWRKTLEVSSDEEKSTSVCHVTTPESGAPALIQHAKIPKKNVYICWSRLILFAQQKNSNYPFIIININVSDTADFSVNFDLLSNVRGNRPPRTQQPISEKKKTLISPGMAALCLNTHRFSSISVSLF